MWSKKMRKILQCFNFLFWDFPQISKGKRGRFAKSEKLSNQHATVVFYIKVKDTKFCAQGKKETVDATPFPALRYK